MTRLALTLALAAGTLCILGVVETRSSSFMARSSHETHCARLEEGMDSDIDSDIESDIDEADTDRDTGGLVDGMRGSTACERENKCRQPCDTGFCKALLRKWYYDIKDAQCKRFIYGGCGGNGNKFETRAQCQSVCGGYELR